MFQLSTDTETPAEVRRKEIKEMLTEIEKVHPQEILDSISESQARPYQQRTSEHPVGEQSFTATIDGNKKRIVFSDMASRTKFGEGGTRFVYVALPECFDPNPIAVQHFVLFCEAGRTELKMEFVGITALLNALHQSHKKTRILSASTA